MERTDGSQLLLKCNIIDLEVSCLLDTGAEISVLGQGSEEIIKKAQSLPIDRKINIITAGGEKHAGTIKRLPVHYENETKLIQFIHAPSIKVPIALGMNFFNAWGIKLMRKKSREIFKMCVENNDSEVENDSANEDSGNEEQEEAYELTKEEKLKVEEALRDIRFSDGDVIGLQRVIQHHIDTGDAEPIFSLPYRYNPNVKEKIQAIIERWLALGVIEPSISNWRLPIITVLKSDKSLRLCLDARKLNAITKKDLHMPPNVLHKIGNLPQHAKYFLRLDFNEAFLQTELSKESRKKTAFALPGIGEYQFVRMPFGLTNSPATQSRLMEKIFEGVNTDYVSHYLDDVIIMGHSFTHLIENIKIVAKKLNEWGLTVSRKKTSSVLRSVRILGHVVDERGIHVDERKTRAVMKWQKPMTGKEMQRFLGFCNWYRRFIKNYAEMAAPLYEICNKKKIKAEDWSEVRNKQFEKLKKCMCNAPVLRTPDWTKKMIIQTDASDDGIGAVLAQIDNEGNEYVIEYYSYSFKKNEKKYTATEKEMLAVIKATRKFKYYIEYNELMIISDHHALKYLTKMKLLNGRLARWILELQPYVNKIVHRAGKLMTVADAISRARYDSMYESNLRTIDSQDVSWYDEFIEEIIENADNYPQYVVQNEKIFKKIPWKRNELDDDYKEIPRTEKIVEIIKKAHEKTCHAGLKGTWYEVAKYYWWPNMKNDIREQLDTCTSCASVKFPNYNLRAPLGTCRVPNNTMEALSIDIKGTLPRAGIMQYRNIITVIDLLSRFAWAKRVTDCTSNKIKQFLEEIFNDQQTTPKYLYHDNGKVFISHDFQEFLRRKNIRSLPTATHHPQANPVERFNRNLTQAIRFEIIKNVNRHNVWATALNEIVRNLNERVNAVTGYAPYEVHYGRIPDPMTYADAPKNDEIHKKIKEIARKRTILRYLQNRKQFNERAFRRDFQVGELVMVRIFHLSNTEKSVTGKLFPPYNLAKVVAKISAHDYKVKKLNNDEVVVNTKHLKNISTRLQEKLAYLFETNDA
ncbi:hypothetical protein PVAND_008444 [Polypedilum vanderplanki]|uniref:RNA-directed DNA polymerase n=1 Tax=Polypedilum vanderplanki TaxID=319348 RepID=A0A9J6C9T2_POLVA|nr:hypothetical protein PVAND_008444 [Polypedilum vanderplanki]